MSHEQIKHKEKTAEQAFYELFPKQIIEEIEAKGEELVDPFTVLSKFDITFVPDEHSYILGRLSHAMEGNQLHFEDTPEGVRIRAKNAKHLLRSMDFIYLHGDIIDRFPQKTKDGINEWHRASQISS